MDVFWNDPTVIMVNALGYSVGGMDLSRIDPINLKHIMRFDIVIPENIHTPHFLKTICDCQLEY